VLLSRWEPAADGRRQQPGSLVAGLVPRARGIEDEDLAHAVNEREELIARRARELAEDAVRTGRSWARPFGPPPKRSAVADAWWDRLAVIAAYRERWQVNVPGILGDEPGSESLQQAAHRERARRAGQEAAVVAGVISPRPPAPSPSAAPDLWVEPGVDL
jgi:hypothetical protein